MSEIINNSAVMSADEQADKKILKQIGVCILVMMGIAIAIVSVANSIA
ncbi:MAG: hypothetical protein AB8B93_20715 [Pseudomonadales bacterium]